MQIYTYIFICLFVVCVSVALLRQIINHGGTDSTFVLPHPGLASGKHCLNTIIQLFLKPQGVPLAVTSAA